jgi:hypothetical protein
MTKPIDFERNPPSGTATRHPALDDKSPGFAGRVKESIEIMLGRRGSVWDRVMTFRDAWDLGLLQRTPAARAASGAGTGGAGSGVSDDGTPVIGNKTIGQYIADQFDKELRSSRLFKDLTRKIGSLEELEAYPAELRQLLSSSLDQVARERQADIVYRDHKIQTLQMSMASSVKEVTAAVAEAQAGVRHVDFAYATKTEALASSITTVTARLNNAGGTGVTVEQKFIAQTSDISGLYGQYTLKIDVNGKISGFGLASTSTASLFSINADRFAIYNGSSDIVLFSVSGSQIEMNTNVVVKGGINIAGGNFQVTQSTGAVIAYNFVGVNSQFSNTSNGSLPAIQATANALGTGAVAIDAQSSSSNSNSHGLRGRNTSFGRSGIVGVANGSHAFYAENGTYGPFTGSHDALIPSGAAIEPGDILVDVDCVGRKGFSDSIFIAAISSMPNDRRAAGVFVCSEGPLSNNQPAAMMEGVTDTPGGIMPIMSGAYYDLANTHDYVIYNGVGEGQVNVCGEGGDIVAGDLIVTSSMPGKGMKQSDDIVRSYTVARARESVTFTSPDEVKTVACIYLCG